MLAFPQNRVFLGLVVRFSLKNYWFIAQSKLLALVIKKLEAGSGRGLLCCRIQPLVHRQAFGIYLEYTWDIPGIYLV